MNGVWKDCFEEWMDIRVGGMHTRGHSMKEKEHVYTKGEVWRLSTMVRLVCLEEKLWYLFTSPGKLVIHSVPRNPHQALHFGCFHKTAEDAKENDNDSELRSRRRRRATVTPSPFG